MSSGKLSYCDKNTNSKHKILCRFSEWLRKDLQQKYEQQERNSL